MMTITISAMASSSRPGMPALSAKPVLGSAVALLVAVGGGLVTVAAGTSVPGVPVAVTGGSGLGVRLGTRVGVPGPVVAVVSPPEGALVPAAAAVFCAAAAVSCAAAAVPCAAAAVFCGPLSVLVAATA